MNYVWSEARQAYIPARWVERYHPIWDVVAGITIVLLVTAWWFATS